MASKILQLALLLGGVAALPQPGWEQWLKDQHNSTTTAKSSTTTTTITKTTSISSFSRHADGWHKWSNATTTSANAKSSSWAAWGEPSEVASTEWNNWKPASSSSANSQSGRPGSYRPGVSQSESSQGSTYQSGSYQPNFNGVGTSNSWSPWDSTDGNEWLNEPAEYTVEAPTHHFVPSIHWDHDLSDPKYIKPCDRNSFYLTVGEASADEAHDMAWLHINFTSQAIALDHSDLFTYTYSSSSKDLQVVFKTQAAYKIAQNDWKKGLILAFYDETCENGQCWLQADEFTFNDASSSCKLQCHALSMEEALHYYEFEWGQYEPGHNTWGKGPSGSGGTGSSTSTSKTTSYGGSSTTGYTSATTTSRSSTSVSSSVTPISTGDATPGNYTIGKVKDPNNCTAPRDTVYGLPTACLGRHFDENIDDTYGYDTVENSAFASFASPYYEYYRDDAGTTTDEERAGWSDDDEALALNTPFQKRLIRNPFKPLIKAVAKKIPIKGIGKPLNINLVDKTFDLRAPQQKDLTDTKKWEKQQLIKEWKKASTNGKAEGSIRVFCVDCGTKGSANIKGSIGISVAEGIDYLKAEAKADIEIALKLGLELDLEYKNSYNKNFYQVGIPKLSYEPFLTVGPFVRVGAEVEINIGASGTILVGGVVAIKEASASFDIISAKGQSSGWQPSFTPIFEAEGEVSASASFGLPVALALGISANRGKYSADVALVNKPSLTASAKISGSANTKGGSIGAPGECNGIDTALTFNNELYIQWPNKNKFPLFSIDPRKLAGKCIAIPGLTTGQNNPAADDGTNDVNKDGTPTAGTSVEDNGDANQDSENNGQTVDPAPVVEGVDPFAERRRRSLEQPIYKRQNDSTDIQDTTDATLATAVKDNVGYVNLRHGDRAYSITNGQGYEMSVMTDSEKNYQVLPCVNGNLLLFTRADARKIPDYECDRYWTIDVDGAVAMDGSGRLLLFYPDEMSKTGVSRIRLAHPKEIPVGTNELTFWPAETQVEGESKTIYYPLDPQETTYYPVVCHYSDKHYTEMFVVKDVDSGISTLKSSSVKYSITGGNVDECYYFPMTQNNGRDDQTNRAGQFDYIQGLNSTTNTTLPSTTSTTSSKRSARFRL